MIQRKVIRPADFADLDALASRLLAFEARYNTSARPFGWTFTRADLITQEGARPKRQGRDNRTTPGDGLSRARASLTPTQLGGHWSTYWYNGLIYESGITRGLLVWNPRHRATAGAQKLDHLNPQTQEFTIGLALGSQQNGRAGTPA